MGGCRARAPRGVPAVFGGGAVPGTTLALPGPAPCGRCTRDLRNAASGPIRARIHHISYKVSQNGQVSPEFDQKACHSPYLQNGLQISPLEILRFPFLLAFSCKELMGHFGRVSEVYCQNDEVSPRCTLPRHAKWSPDTPCRNTVATFLIWLSAACRIDLFPDILNGPCLY